MFTTKIVKFGQSVIRHDRHMVQVGILGVPFCKGQPRAGTDLGPKAIRDHGLIERLNSIHEDIDVKDFGDVTYDLSANDSKVHNMIHYEHIPPCMEQLSRDVSKIIKDKRLCVTIGGDHSIGIGTVNGHLHAHAGNVSVLWVDAHADINTAHTSPTGNVHGMPMSLLCRELRPFSPHMPGMEWQKGALDARHIAYIGLRAVDPFERQIIEQFHIAAYGMEELQQYGVNRVVQMALQRIDPTSSRSIHVSFDIDALDVHEAPSTGTAVRGGLSLREGVHIVEKVLETGRLGAIDLVEVNPQIGSDRDVQTTVESAVNILMAACGHRRGGLVTKNTRTLPVPDVPRRI